MPYAADLTTLLREQNIAGVETPIAHDGYSGAPLSTIECGGKRYFIKRIGRANDWIARATDDTHGREAQFAASDLIARLPKSIAVPSLGVAHDGEGWAMLMRDIAPYLIPDDGSLLAADVIDEMLASIATMHAQFWRDPLPSAGISWTPIERRLRLLSPDEAPALAAEGIDVGAVRGWAAFEEVAPPAAVDLMRRLFADMSGLLAAVDAAPQTLLHGDLRLGNMGVGDGKLWLFDWATVTRAPVSLELAWFLAVNSSRFSIPLADVHNRYCDHLRAVLTPRALPDAEWERLDALMFILGFLLDIWGKANVAAAGQPDELRWWCDGALAGAKLLHV